jgi:agmatine deiminase
VNNVFPAEWSEHSATWFTWPRNPDTWTDVLEAVRREVAKAMVHIAKGEKVYVNVSSAEEAEQVRELTDGIGGITCLPFESNDSWCRDHGPTFVKTDIGAAGICWNYNGWGGKYPPFDLDEALAAKMTGAIGTAIQTSSIVLEGGALETNGSDILLTTASCVLNPNRNPGLSRTDAEQELSHRTGMAQIGWVEGDLPGDDTDGHIDNLARFAGKDRILIDERILLEANTVEIQRLSRSTGRDIKLIPIPAAPSIEHEGNPLPTSHLNFYITNAVVLVPAYGGNSDGRSIDIIQNCFPDREVVAMNCREVIRGLGAIHCLTQQVPALDGLSKFK